MRSRSSFFKKYEKMAENKVHGNEEGPFVLDSEDTPVPAAEVLIDLKESARRRRVMQKLRTSPRRRKPTVIVSDSPKKTPNHRGGGRRLNFSDDSSSLMNNFSGSSDGEEVTEVTEVTEDSVPPPRKSKRLMAAMASTVNQSVYTSPSKQRPDQAILHSASSRLRNLLKLHKAHKWCYYEWFYSDIDGPLLEGENDFCRCLTEMFPGLKTRRLTRVHWRQLRRLMGKPRRCSPMFFAEERSLLEYRRDKVRQIQQQVHQGIITVGDFSQFKDIPDEIPALLVVGTPITARLHTDKEKGFFTGRIEAVDIDSHSYWVTFDRPGLGKHPIPDTEIRSSRSRTPEVVSISALEATQKSQWPREHHHHHHLRPRTPPRGPRPILPATSAIHAALQVLSPDPHVDPFLASSPAKRRMLNEQPAPPGAHMQLPDHVGGFPVDFLKQITQLSKLLALKQEMVQRLTNMNTEVEKMQARQWCLTAEFQRQYATIIIELDDINKQLNLRLDAIRSHCEALGYGAEIGACSMNVHEHAQKITESANTSLEASGSEVKEPGLLDLISRLTGLLLQIEVLSESGDSLELSSLSKCIEELQTKIHPENKRLFQDHVETPLTLIQSGMNPVGTLHAFSVGTFPRTMTPYPNS